MKKIILITILGLSIFASVALAQKVSKIELNNGSVIMGEVTGVNNGTYSINSPEMGTLQIAEKNIKQIGFANSSENLTHSPKSTDISPEKMDALRNKLLGDKDTMGMVMSLQNDPQFQEVLKDPDIINAIKSGNTAALMNNEKFMQLKNNPTVQKIKDRAGE